eukprot:357663-Chlamydomonas_euryale.AAC.18
MLALQPPRALASALARPHREGRPEAASLGVPSHKPGVMPRQRLAVTSAHSRNYACVRYTWRV